MTVNGQLNFGLDFSLINKQPDFLSAINLCVDLSGIPDDSIHEHLGIAQAQWSRIRKGNAHFPPNKLEALMDYCGNEVPLVWLAIKRHYELIPTLSAMEKRIAEKDALIAEQNIKIKHFEEFMKMSRS